jgi:hypothetical protein
MVDACSHATPDPLAGSAETKKRFAALMAAVAALRRPTGTPWGRTNAVGGGNERDFLFAITLPDQGTARSAASVGVVGRRCRTDGGRSRWN